MLGVDQNTITKLHGEEVDLQKVANKLNGLSADDVTRVKNFINGNTDDFANIYRKYGNEGINAISKLQKKGISEDIIKTIHNKNGDITKTINAVKRSNGMVVWLKKENCVLLLKVVFGSTMMVEMVGYI